MIEANAWYFDRDVPYRTMVRLLFEEGGRLRIEGEGVALDHPLRAIQFSRGEDGQTRIIQLPDGSRCESLDIDRLETALKLHGIEEQVAKAVSRLKGKGRWIDGGIVAVLLLAFGAGWWLMPPWAAQTMSALPSATVQAISQKTLDLLATELDVSTIPAAREEAIIGQWQLATQDLPGAPFPLLFRGAPKIGPFLFGLPNGTFIVTDPLLRALDDQGVLTLLFHELGHVRGDHALAMLGREHPLQVLESSPLDSANTPFWSAQLRVFLSHGPYTVQQEQQAALFAAPIQTALEIAPDRFSLALATVLETTQRGNFPLFYTDLHPEGGVP